MKNSLEYLADIKPVNWLRTAIYGLLFVLLYKSTIIYLLSKWRSDDYTYCYIIPFIVLYMIWEKRIPLAENPSVPSWTGFVPLVIGLICYWLGELGGEYTILFFSCWFVMVALCWISLGWRKLRIIGFPFLFCLAMFVPPNAIYAPLSLKLKLVSSKIGIYMLQLYGISAYREGNVIDLGFTKLQVVDACSGLRYVIPLFVMGVLIAYYYQAALWKKIFMVASTVPLSIITNSLRIASVGILYQFWGVAAAEETFHDFSGWFIFMASLGILLAEMWLLNKVFKEPGREKAERRKKKPGAGEMESGVERRETQYEERNFSHLTFNFLPALLRPLQFIVAVILLFTTVSIAQTVNFREKIPLMKPFAYFPIKIGEWSGVRTPMEQKFLDTLHLSDYLLIDYRNPSGKTINLYVAYYASQLKGASIHSPATCLPGSGWVFEESGPAQLPLSGVSSPAITVRRAFMRKNGERMLVYYWFPQRGRILTGVEQLKLYTFWDALTRQRTDGALARVITPLVSGEEPAAAEERLRGFCRDAVPVLDGYLPR